MNDDDYRLPENPASNLKETWRIFHPQMAVDPSSYFYVERTDDRLRRLTFELANAEGQLHAFLCGHQGSGKTTELSRLHSRTDIREKYLSIFLTANEFGKENVHLTHDALMVEIGQALAELGLAHGMDESLRKELEDWGRSVVKSFYHGEGVEAEAGSKAGAWLAYFRAALKSRREWSTEERREFEPRVLDLLEIINRMAADLRSKSGKRILVIVDDLEKGDSSAHREMHRRIFQENYETLVQPRFSIIYTLPIYFRALPENRVPSEQLYAFSALRIYSREEKKKLRPQLDKFGSGYQVMRDFVERRVTDWKEIFASEDDLDELIRIGGGLFRETARAIHDAAYSALDDEADKIGPTQVRRAFDQVKKDYQPMIRGEAVGILKSVLESDEGWIEGVERLLQSKAVAEYENGYFWLDVRYAVKQYVHDLEA